MTAASGALMVTMIARWLLYGGPMPVRKSTNRGRWLAFSHVREIHQHHDRGCGHTSPPLASPTAASVWPPPRAIESTFARHGKQALRQRSRLETVLLVQNLTIAELVVQCAVGVEYFGRHPRVRSCQSIPRHRPLVRRVWVAGSHLDAGGEHGTITGKIHDAETRREDSVVQAWRLLRRLRSHCDFCRVSGSRQNGLQGYRPSLFSVLRRPPPPPKGVFRQRSCHVPNARAIICFVALALRENV